MPICKICHKHVTLGVMAHSECYEELSNFDNTQSKLLLIKISELREENEELKARLEKSVKPPCEVGDIVYVDKKTLCDWYTFGEYENYIKAKVIGIKITKKQKLVNLKPITERTTNTRYHKFYPFSSFGKTVFLTKEEAENALKESELNA